MVYKLIFKTIAEFILTACIALGLVVICVVLAIPAVIIACLEWGRNLWDKDAAGG